MILKKETAEAFKAFAVFLCRGGKMKKRSFIIALLAVSLMAVVGCNPFTKKEAKMVIKEGAKVSINYVLKVDGKVVDSSENGGPLTYTQGSSQIIPGLEKQLTGLKAGDKKNVSVNPEEGYGEHNPQAIQKVPKKAFKETGTLKVGTVVTGVAGDREFQAMVVEIGKEEITLDLNHPLAGKKLDFEIEVISVQ